MLDHFAPLGSKYGIFSILQSVTRYGNLVLPCDFAENHCPAYVSKCLFTSEGFRAGAGGCCQRRIMSWIHNTHYSAPSNQLFCL